MTRTQKLLHGFDLATSSLIEIGALDRPIVPPDTPKVFYVDHASTPDLRKKYATDPHVNIDRLVDVHGVWGEHTLAEIAALVAPVDGIVASHVIEHVPDLIGWFVELASVLKPGGEVRLCIPDKRYTFDLPRAETQIADVLSAHLMGARVPQARAILDHFLNVAHVDCVDAWEERITGETATRQVDSKAAIEAAEDMLANGSYRDSHCWVFTPHSFAVLMGRLTETGHQPFRCASFSPTERHTFEFFVTLEACDDKQRIVESWKTLQAQVLAQSGELRSVVREELAEALRQVDALRAEVELLREHTADHRVQAALSLEVRASLQQQVESLNTVIGDLRGSTSWKVTAPLRAVRRLFK